jgi:hypothetical protein
MHVNLFAQINYRDPERDSRLEDPYHLHRSEMVRVAQGTLTVLCKLLSEEFGIEPKYLRQAAMGLSISLSSVIEGATTLDEEIYESLQSFEALSAPSAEENTLQEDVGVVLRFLAKDREEEKTNE